MSTQGAQHAARMVVLRSPKSIRVSPTSMPYSAPHRLQRGRSSDVLSRCSMRLMVLHLPGFGNELEVAGAKGRCEDARYERA